MGCLGRLDLIAYPGSRYSQTFKAPTEEAFRDALALCLTRAGWDVVPAAGVFGGTSSYKATSRQAPWCPDSVQPAEFVGKCKVHFYSALFRGETYFRVLNADETMISTNTTDIALFPTNNVSLVGDLSKYSYFFIGNQFDFKVFMLGVSDRVARGITNQNTAVFAGVPQIPAFLQARDMVGDQVKWCQYGVNEMFYLIDASPMRTSSLQSGAWAGGISSEVGGTLLNSGVGRFRFTYGVGNAANSDPDGKRSHYWIGTGGDDPELWDGLLWPPLIVWTSDPADLSTDRKKGFQYDSLIVNKAFPGDAMLRFDGHEFIAFTHDWHGQITGAFNPPGCLLLATSGAF